MASTSHRASLEPLAPAVAGIGLLHVLGGMVLWIVMPMLPETVSPAAQLPANLVWRTPEDFVGVAAPVEPPQVVQDEKQPAASPAVETTPPAAPSGTKPAPAGQTAAVTAPEPAKPAEPTKPGRISFTPASKNQSAVSVAPTGLSGPGGAGGLRRLPPDTLTMLQNSLGSSSGMDGVNAGAAAQILGATPPAVSAPPSARPQDGAPPPVQAGEGRDANKYITLSAISEPPPMPAKPTLSLLDIAKLNDLERERKASASSAGLDAVDSALQQTLMRAWVPPSIDLVPAHQRRVSAELSVLKDGTVKGAILVSLSGSEPMDSSVRAALARVTKIPESLPATYSKESYAVRVNLQIE